jgi:hypothetical protein
MMGIIRQSIIASIYFSVTPVSSILKMVDGRSVGIEGEEDSKAERKSRKENIPVLVLMELSHGLILGTDWINKIAGTSIYPSTSAEQEIPDSIFNPSRMTSAVQSRLPKSEMEKLLTKFGNLFHGNDTVAEYHINAKEQQPIPTTSSISGWLFGTRNNPQSSRRNARSWRYGIV